MRQKAQHDKKAQEPLLNIGERGMVFMPRKAQGKQRELTLPNHGPCHILDLTSTGATVRPVDQPDQKPILVNLDHVIKCSSDLPDVSGWAHHHDANEESQAIAVSRRSLEHLPDGDVQVEACVTQEMRKRGGG